MDLVNDYAPNIQDGLSGPRMSLINGRLYLLCRAYPSDNTQAAARAIVWEWSIENLGERAGRRAEGWEQATAPQIDDPDQ